MENHILQWKMLNYGCWAVGVKHFWTKVPQGTLLRQIRWIYRLAYVPLAVFWGYIWGGAKSARDNASRRLKLSITLRSLLCCSDAILSLQSASKNVTTCMLLRKAYTGWKFLERQIGITCHWQKHVTLCLLLHCTLLHFCHLMIRIQVAKLWQRDRAKLDMFSINVQRYLQNHKIAFFWVTLWGHQGQYKRFIWNF